MRRYPIPFFVVDRPMSLKLLEHCKISELPFKVGLMGHVNTSENFRKQFKHFKGNNIIKMADSGVFSKDGSVFDYEDLFEIYEKMGVEYGVMIDVLKNKNKTLKSARKAIKIYNKNTYKFNLVGVAQGKDEKEYLDCYIKLKKLGFEFIAIGGLLKKIENSSRYVKVRNEEFLDKVVSKIRNEFPKDWLFLLGCYHPKRFDRFVKFKIFGADYKGWIFNYTIPSEEERRSKSREELRRERFDQVKSYLYNQVFKNYFSFIAKPGEKKKLLLISCSKKKKKQRTPLPAIQLYDGPFFKLIRKYIDELDNLDVYIISAKYGLINSSEKIVYYDQRMDKKRAIELSARIIKELNRIIDEYDEILINLGKDYLSIFETDGGHHILENPKVEVLDGKIGIRMNKMKNWLESIKYYKEGVNL